jgi:PAN domain-containing protein
VRPLLHLVGALLLAAASVTQAAAQTGFDRRGGDYTSFAIRNGDPSLCAARCEHDGRCKAWSFSYPRTAAPAATCWLKNKVTSRNEDACCVSGVRGAGVVEPHSLTTEFNIDRLGGDYRSLDVAADAVGDTCKAACEADNKCRAWTYARPGYISVTPRCYLKNNLKPPRSKPCCISGVVR